MKFAIGTPSEGKVSVLQTVLQSLVPGEKIDIVPYAAHSGVPDTPWDDETFAGAKNRAEQGKQFVPDADCYIGLESGLVTRFGTVYEEAWCYVLTFDNQVFTGYSSGLRVPDQVLQKMKHGKHHWEVLREIRSERGIDGRDTWGLYTGNVLGREISLSEALRNTFIQIFKPKDGLF